MTADALEMTGVSKAFGGVCALESASLTVRPGEAHALVGANGAGKSTLMNILGGVVAPDEGQIRIAGRDVTVGSPREARANGIAFVHQELAMLASMTVAENVLIDDLPLRAGLTDRTRMAERTQALLDRLGCSFSPGDPVERLGMGDRQMVEIARALASKPTILIFDEPTSSLSAREKMRLFDVIRRLKAWHAVTDKSGMVQTLESVPTEWNPDLFRSGTVNAFRAHPDANCMFLASDFALPAVQSALQSVNRWAKRGEPNHVWIATQDVFPEAVKAMQEGYVDLGTSYDAYAHAKEAIRQAILIAKGEKSDCPDSICLVKGRLVTQENVNTIPNLWSRAGK